MSWQECRRLRPQARAAVRGTMRLLHSPTTKGEFCTGVAIKSDGPEQAQVSLAEAEKCQAAVLASEVAGKHSCAQVFVREKGAKDFSESEAGLVDVMNTLDFDH